MADGQAKCQGAWPHEAHLSLVKEIPGGSGTGTAEGARLESRAQANRLQRLQLDPGSLPKWAAGELTSFTPRRCREVKSKELQIAEHWAQLRAEARWGDSVLKTGSSESWHVKDMPTEPFSSHPQPLPGSDTVPPEQKIAPFSEGTERPQRKDPEKLSHQQSLGPSTTLQWSRACRVSR